MRIAISTSSSSGIQKEGLAVYLDNLLRALQEVDSTNDYFIFMPRAHINVFCITAPNFHIVPMHDYLHRSGPNILWHLFVYPLLLRKWRIDVVHLPEIRRIPIVKPCSTVMTIHDMVNLKVVGRAQGAQSWYYRLVIRYLPRVIDKIYVVSQNTRYDVHQALGIDESQIAVIYNGVSERFKPFDRYRARQRLLKYHLPEKYIICVSRLEHPQKNQITLLRAFALLKKQDFFQHKLVLVGMKWSNHEVILEEIERLALQSDVKWYGYVSEDDLPYFYNAADLSVYPSLYEGFGFPVVEAMASACPVITSNVSSMPEVIGDSGLLFSPLDHVELAKQIKTILSDGALHQEITQRGLHRAKLFSWRAAAQKTVAVYESCASAPQSLNSSQSTNHNS